MPINTELSQLVFRKSIITEKYIGGLEQFKEDFEFSLGEYNMEDNELISMAAMNPDELDLKHAASNFHRIVDEDNYITGSDDFVVVNRYGGKMWDNEWITGDAGKGSVFFWDVTASVASIQEAQDRSNCPMDEIETRYGTWMKWGEVIM